MNTMGLCIAVPTTLRELQDKLSLMNSQICMIRSRREIKNLPNNSQIACAERCQTS